MNKIFDDFEELITGIDQFKTNVRDSNKLLNTLAELASQIEESKKSLDSKFNIFLPEIKNANDNLSKHSQEVTEKLLQLNNELKNELDKRHEVIITEISKIKDNIKMHSDQVTAKIDKANKDQHEISAKNTERLLSEIKTLNTKFFILFGSVGVSIIIGVIALI
jgi:hypothetical protein